MRSLLPIVAVIVAFAAFPATASEDETDLGQPNPEWKRLKAAEKLTKKGDIDAVYRAVTVTVERGDDKDIEVLVSLAVREENPLLRLLYGRGLEKIGPAKVVPALTEKLVISKPMERIRGIEVLGFLRDPSSIEALMGYTSAKDRQVAIEAFRALARIFPKKDIKRLVAAAVAADSRRTTYRAAWGIADIYKSAKGAAGAFRKESRSKTPSAERAKKAMSDLSGEGIDWVFRYPKTHLVGVEKFFGGEHREIPVEGDLLSLENMKKALEHLKTKAPDYYQFVTRVFKAIDNKRPSHIASPIVWSTRTLSFQRGEAKSWNPEILSYMMVRAATRLLMRDCGDVHKGRRGLTTATVNAYWYCRKYTLVDTRRNMDEFIDHLVRQKLWKE
jgi:hypothetical protein